MSMNENNEPIIQINVSTREIFIPPELTNFVVCGDHLCETIYFTCPRYFDDIDLSQHTCIVRYINAGNEYGEDTIENLIIEDNSIILGWSISNNVTRYSGKVNFTIQFETQLDGVIEYQWQTVPATINVMAGLKVEETITEKDNLLFRILSKKVQLLQENVNTILQKDVLNNDIVSQLETLSVDVEYLKENVVYVNNE